MQKADKLKIVKDAVICYPDFPSPGILFRDIFGIFKNTQAMLAMKDLILGHLALLDFDIVIGLESRGFLLGSMISFELAKPFIPIRKKGKLPGKCFQETYTLEYGEDTLEMQADASQNGRRKAVVVDDLLATGGTMAAAEKLIQCAGILVVECLVLMELKSLCGRAKLKNHVHSLIQYD